MLKVLTVQDILALVRKERLEPFFLKLIDRLESDFRCWEAFDKSPRFSHRVPLGILELMPIADQEYFSCKYVNGHQENPKQGKLTVVALGLLARVDTGYPILLSEMTLLTAFRTAAVSALATKYLARRSAKTFGMIGTGAQAEFQTLAHVFALGIREIYYFDTRRSEMEKFAANLEPYNIELFPCKSGREVVENSDIVTSATAREGHQKIIEAGWPRPGAHINAIGGDRLGKTEIDPALLAECTIVVEQLEQAAVEGEVQQIGKKCVYAELWEIATGRKKGRTSETEFTLFDSVGFALEDYTALRFVLDLAEKHQIGHELDLLPETLQPPNNLFSLLQG